MNARQRVIAMLSDKKDPLQAAVDLLHQIWALAPAEGERNPENTVSKAYLIRDALKPFFEPSREQLLEIENKELRARLKQREEEEDDNCEVTYRGHDCRKKANHNGDHDFS